MTGDEHILVVEKLKARGNETDASDEETEWQGELTLVHDVFCLLMVLQLASLSSSDKTKI